METGNYLNLHKSFLPFARLDFETKMKLAQTILSELVTAARPSRQRLGVRQPSGAFHAADGKRQRAAAVQNLAALRTRWDLILEMKKADDKIRQPGARSQRAASARLSGQHDSEHLFRRAHQHQRHHPNDASLVGRGITFL